MIGISERNNRIGKSKYLKSYEVENFPRIVEKQSAVVKKKLPKIIWQIPKRNWSLSNISTTLI